VHFRNPMRTMTHTRTLSQLAKRRAEAYFSKRGLTLRDDVAAKTSVRHLCHLKRRVSADLICQALFDEQLVADGPPLSPTAQALARARSHDVSQPKLVYAL
jgi:hypothetical protein